MSEPDVMTSEELLSRAKACEAAAFGMLVRTHQRSVYGLALRMLSDRQQAQELVQDVFLRLHRNLASVESASHLEFWLRKVTLNRAIDSLRRRDCGYESVSLEKAAQIAGEAANDDPLLQRRLADLLAQLPPTPRTVLELRYRQDLDPTEIARALNMPVNTVKSHLKRSLAILRERWLESVLITCILLGLWLGHLRHVQRGLQARQQVIEALRLTQQKLDVAYQVIKENES